MAQTVELVYGPATPMNISLNGLTDGSMQQSDLFDNTVELYVDIIVQLTVDFPNLAPANTQTLALYFSASLDGSTFDGTGVTGADGTYTSADQNNLYNMMGFYPIQNQVSSKSANFTYYQGFVPPFFSFVVLNTSGQTLGPASAVTVTGVKVQSV